MKETTVLNKIQKLIEELNYKEAYVTILTDTSEYNMKLQKRIPAGFRYTIKGDDKNELV